MVFLLVIGFFLEVFCCYEFINFLVFWVGSLYVYYFYYILDMRFCWIEFYWFGGWLKLVCFEESVGGVDIFF